MVGAMPQDIVSRLPVTLPAIIGKLPAHGDFIARGVDFAWREPLDRWLSAWMKLGRKRIGDGFDDAYREAAPWIFEGGRTKAVLMPSADAVGRLFPVLCLTSARRRIQPVYDILVDALSNGMKSDDLIASLAGIVAETDAGEDASSGWFLPNGAERVLPSPDEADGWNDVAECFE